MSDKSLDTLVQDIYGVFDNPSVSQEQIDNFGKEVSEIIGTALTERKESRLRMSMIGQPCQRKLWYEINMPEAAEPLDGQTRFKFLILVSNSGQTTPKSTKCTWCHKEMISPCINGVESWSCTRFKSVEWHEAVSNSGAELRGDFRHKSLY